MKRVIEHNLETDIGLINHFRASIVLSGRPLYTAFAHIIPRYFYDGDK